MDTTGESNLKSIVRHFHKQGGTILISGIQDQPNEILIRTELYEEIGKGQFFEHTGDAINYALSHLEHSKCHGCKHYAFQERTQLAQGQHSESEETNEFRTTTV